MESKNATHYGEDHIKVLEGLEAVRTRPEMYIGSRDKKGLHHLLWEILDNSVDEHMAGHCNKIDITIHKDDSITVSDNGRGIPVGIHSTEKIPTLEVVLTVLHAGGKFGGDSPYESAGGLHGVGSACVNALSSEMVATVKREGKIHQIKFEKGITTKELEVIGKTKNNETGTTIWFKPDASIFKETTEYDFQVVFNRLRESAFLNAGLKINLIDERSVNEEGKYHSATFEYKDGMKDFIRHLNKNKKTIVDEIFHIKEITEGVYVEAGFQYTNNFDENIISFANNIKTTDGGTHETGYRTAITQTMNEIINSRNLIKEDDEQITGDDIRTGLVSVISVKVPEPQFEGQTKNRLTNSEVRQIVQKTIRENFTKILSDNPRLIKPITDKILNSYEERINIQKARRAIRKQNRREDSSFTLPEKLADCDQRTPLERRELFIVEGDSAGGSAKNARDNLFQAILPLRGKILNVQKATQAKIESNVEIENIKTTIGTGIGEEFNIEQLRYNKIIIMTDADVDGSHIQILLLTFFYRYMRPLLENGHIYLAQPPLYGVRRGNRVVEYLNDDEELNELLKRNPRANIQRYKGLGEMNANELGQTTMDPTSRKLIRVEMGDAYLVNELFESLMGDSPFERRNFIEQNSHRALLDI